MNTPRLAIAVGTIALGPSSAVAQSPGQWDLPAAYPANNFHTENLVQFAADVEKATAVSSKITVHPNGSLSQGARDQARAVQGGRRRSARSCSSTSGERERDSIGADGIPFLATSYADSKKLAAAQKPLLDKLLGAQGMKLLYTVPWPPQGIYVNKEIGSVADMCGLKWRAYSPATGQDRRTGRRAAGHGAGRRAVAGAGDRRSSTAT